MKYSELSIGQFIHALSGGETGIRRQQHLLSYKNLSFSSQNMLMEWVIALLGEYSFDELGVHVI
jgi:hypothetical protein